MIPFSIGIEDTAQDSTLSLVSGAKATDTDMQIGMNRVTTTYQAGYFPLDRTGISDCTMRIKVDSVVPWEKTGLFFQFGDARPIAPNLGVEAVSAEVSANATRAAVDLVSAQTESMFPEIKLHVMPLSGLDGSSAQVSRSAQALARAQKTHSNSTEK